jgi:hypothetical protein
MIRPSVTATQADETQNGCEECGLITQRFQLSWDVISTVPRWVLDSVRQGWFYFSLRQHVVELMMRRSLVEHEEEGFSTDYAVSILPRGATLLAV